MLTHIGTHTINTERLEIRRFKHTDSDMMLKYWISDSSIQDMYSEPTYTTKEEVDGFLSQIIESYNKVDYYRWALVSKETSECIGQIAYLRGMLRGLDK